MALTLEQFVDQLSASGLVAAEEVRAFRDKNSPADSEQFAKLLVKHKVLTAWQAQQVYAGKAKSLVLGNYVCLEKLGQGGMGMVLKAQHRRMKRMVALKVLSPAVAKSSELIARFHREVEAAAKLSHANIVTAFDADEAGGTSFLVMEYVDGKDLSSVVKSQGPLSLAQACKCLIQAAKGLEYAHDQRIIHRDIKPANLLIDRHGTVKILDMGLARMDTDAGKTELTSTGAVMGTVDYMAPEQALSSKHADARSDIYSLGITLWYLLTGRPTYEGDSMMARLIGHRESAIPSLAEALSRRSAGAKPVPADKARAIDAVFQKMVAKKPEDRYQTMGQVIRALEAIPTSAESIAELGAVDPDATYIVPQMSSPGATAAYQLTKPAGAGTATVKKPQDEDLIPGSPFAATINTGDEASPTAATARTTKGAKKALPPKVGKGAQSADLESSDQPNRRWLILGVGSSGLLFLAAMFFLFWNRGSGSAPRQTPDAPKEVVTDPAPSKPQPAASTTPSTPPSPEKTSQDAGWIPLMSTNADVAAHWQTPGPFRLVKGELQSDKSGAAVSKESYDDFDLEFEWKVGPGANGGVYYRANPTRELIASGSSGMEYQVIDNAGFEKLTPQTSAGSLWGLAAPTRDVARRLGEWNTARIRVAGDHIEHWMNGEKIVEVEVGSQAWKDALGKATERIRGNAGHRNGHILLQSQSGTVSFRNMRLKRMTGTTPNASSSPGTNSAGWTDLLAMVVPYSENSRGVWNRNSNGHLTTDKAGDFPFAQLNFDPRPLGSYNVEIGVILHQADHVVVNLPAGSGIANLILGRSTGGAVWQLSGSFDPAGQPREQKRPFDLKPDVESVIRVRVDVKDNGARARLSGKVNDDLLPIVDRPVTELVKITPPKGLNLAPPKNPGKSFSVHVGQGATATLTRFRYRENP
ncbi:hypothetical protein AYO47_04655 [Planctomyces sp. SCGC AG-212-M04]|nr:hypothetical protein AYO47_04655 [Planctomyces sp. SCGC AG-212-M04]